MDYRFDGRLTARDAKRHIPHQFAVPTDAAQIEVCLRFAPAAGQDLTNLITLSVYDPNGFRGAGHRGGAEHRVSLAASQATPGYLPGPLPAGEWTVELDTHRIMPGEPVNYWLEVTVRNSLDASPAASRAANASPVTRRGPGWYRGDLHTHTHHSDADGLSVAGLVTAARRAGLDFIFLTDHNTTAGLPELEAAGEDDLLTAAGLELTTFWGHALCLGTRQWVDWRIRPGTGQIAQIAAETYAAGRIFIIAHPQSLGDPCCTGCAWRYGEMMPGAARLVEVWNGPWGGDSNNEASLALWYDWLNQGHRLVATAGSDLHSVTDYDRRPGFNVIYADGLTEAALLRALAVGHLYLSAGPQLAFQAQAADGSTAISGDTVAGLVAFTLTWTACPADAHIRVIANGMLLHQWAAAPGNAQRGWQMTAADARWVLVEVRDRDGQILAVTNPIFLG